MQTVYRCDCLVVHLSILICPLPLFCYIDGDKGAPNRSVDIQKNRIVATAALKEAEPLADQGKSVNYCDNITSITDDLFYPIKVNFRKPRKFLKMPLLPLSGH